MFGLIEFFILYAMARVAEWFFFTDEKRKKEKVDINVLSNDIFREWIEEDGTVKLVVGNRSTHSVRVLAVPKGTSVVLDDAVMRTTSGHVSQFSGGKILGPGESVVLYFATFKPVSRYEEALVTWAKLVKGLRRAFDIKIIYENQSAFVMPGWITNPPRWPIHVPQCFIRGSDRLVVPSRMADEKVIRDVGALLDGRDFRTWLNITKEGEELIECMKSLRCVGDLRFLSKKDVGEHYDNWRVFYLRSENPIKQEE